MSKPNQDSIMEKIKKLLALAGNNPNENEREVAMKMAEKLMAEHNLEHMKNFKGGDDRSPIDQFVTDISADDWKRFIAHAVCDLYYCKLIITTTGFTEKGKPIKMCKFVGTEINRQVAYEIALWLIATIMKESKDEFFGKSDQEDFCFGAGQVIERRAEEMIREKNSEGAAAAPKSQKNELMVLRKDLARENDDWIRKNIGGLGFATAVSTRHSEAAGAGKSFGAGVNLSRQVGGKAAPKRIG